MARLLAVLLVLSACARRAPAPEKPAKETAGARLYLRDPDGDGRRQWYLLVVNPGLPGDKPRLIFDEGKGGDKAPPSSPVTLSARPFDLSGDPLPDKARSYRLMMMSDDNPRAGARGVLYEFCLETTDAYPVMWWGLGPDPGFDRMTPAANWAALKTLFAKKP